MEKMLQILAENPFLTDASHELIELFAHCASSVHFDPGTFLVREGDRNEAGYLIVDGLVSIEVAHDSGERARIDTAGAGELLDWSWLFPPHRSRFDARAETAVHAVRLGGPCLLSKLDEHPAIGYEMMRRFARALHDRLEQEHLRLAGDHAALR
jgi:CRP/FNR family transcriptional regulator, cyclic AMP receptor protein